MLYGSNPVTSVYNQPVVPIDSVPVDADGDNDGVIDMYDSQPLNGNNKELLPPDKETGYVGSDTVFTVLKLSDEIKTVTMVENANVYSYPYGEQINTQFNKNDNIECLVVVYSKEEYWIKIKLDKW